ncbi:hypothetical protein F-M6_0195 [Faustovirus]|nr:hypothetical protein F-M6_0195 [Faustovirus]
MDSLAQGSVAPFERELKITDLPDEIIRRIANPHLEQLDLPKDLKKSHDLICYLTMGQFLRTVNKKFKSLFTTVDNYAPSKIIHYLQQSLTPCIDSLDNIDIVYDFVVKFANYAWLRKFRKNKIFMSAVVGHLLRAKIDTNSTNLLTQLSIEGHIKLQSVCHNAHIENLAIAAKNSQIVLTRNDMISIINYDIDTYIAIIRNLPKSAFINCGAAHEWVVASARNNDMYHTALIQAGVEVTDYSYFTAVRVLATQNAVYLAQRLKQLGRLLDFADTVTATISHNAIAQLITLGEIFEIPVRRLNELVFKYHGVAFICEFINRTNYRFSTTEVLRLIARYRTTDEFFLAIDALGATLTISEQFQILSTERNIGAIIELITRSGLAPTEESINQISGISDDVRGELKHALGVINDVDFNAADDVESNFDDTDDNTYGDDNVDNDNVDNDNVDNVAAGKLNITYESDDDDDELVALQRYAQRPNYTQHLALRWNNMLSPISEASSETSSMASSPRVFTFEDY